MAANGLQMSILTASQAQTAIQPELDAQVLCKHCGSVVTQARHCIEVDGQHEHTFRNPWGYSFHLLCFAQAEGARSEGTPTSEATWFAGYHWSFASCVQCGTHLGWFYFNPSASLQKFAGLIATRLLRQKPS